MDKDMTQQAKPDMPALQILLPTQFNAKQENKKRKKGNKDDLNPDQLAFDKGDPRNGIHSNKQRGSVLPKKKFTDEVSSSEESDMGETEKEKFAKPKI